jgi:hypothetical protein
LPFLGKTENGIIENKRLEKLGENLEVMKKVFANRRVNINYKSCFQLYLQSQSNQCQESFFKSNFGAGIDLTNTFFFQSIKKMEGTTQQFTDVLR